MDFECCWPLGLLLLIVAIITPVGHGIWILLSKLFSLGGGGRGPALPSNPQIPGVPPGMGSQPLWQAVQCPYCGRRTDLPICLSCHTVINRAALLAELSEVHRRLQRLMNMGVIDHPTFVSLTNAIRSHWQATVAPVAPPAGAATSAPAAPVEQAQAARQPQRSGSPGQAAPAATMPGRGAAPAGIPATPVAEGSPTRPGPVPSDEGSRPTAAPTPPGEPLSRMFSAFMEDKNIRWGELIGGMLILFCSTALVVSLWSQISAIPVLKFFIFTAVTAALFLVGLYTGRRWKLPTTSHGILIIATLLVPLNFLAIAAFSTAQSAHGGQQGPVANQALVLAGELVAVVLFLALVYLGGRLILPGWQTVLTIAVVGASACQLVVRRTVSPATTPPTLIALAMLPMAFYFGSMGLALGSRGGRGSRAGPSTTAHLGQNHVAQPPSAVIRPPEAGEVGPRAGRSTAEGGCATSKVRCSARPSISRVKANTLLTLLGLVSFAALASLGLIVFRAAFAADGSAGQAAPGQIGQVLRTLSPVVTLFALPAVAIGLTLWRGVTRISLAGVRTAGTSVAAAGGVVLCIGAVLAWPDPARLLPICLLDAAAFLTIALALRIPAAHLLAAGWATMAYLVGFHLASGSISWTATTDDMASAMFSATTGPALLAPFMVLAGCTVLAYRTKRRADGQFLAVAVIAVGMVSLLLACWHGLGRAAPDDHGATLVLAVYAAAAMVAGVAAHRRFLTIGGQVLLLVVFIQAICFRLAVALHLTEPAVAWQVAMLSYATLGPVAALLARAAALGYFGDIGRRIWSAGGGQPGQPGQAGQSGSPGSLIALSIGTSVVAAIILLTSLSIANTGGGSIRALWLMAVWLALAIVLDAEVLFAAGQFAMVAGVVLAVIHQLSNQPWFVQVANPLLHPRSIQAIGVALGLVSLFGIILRGSLVVRPWLPSKSGLASTLPRCPGCPPVIVKLINSRWAIVDRLCGGLALAFLLVLCLWGVTFGIWDEFAAANLRQATASLPHDGAGQPQDVLTAAWRQTLGSGSWWLLAVTAICQLAGLWERFSKRRVLAIILILAAAAALLAGRWADYGAAAAALRWHLAALWLIASLPMLFPQTIRRLGAGLLNRAPALRFFAGMEIPLPGRERVEGLARMARILLILVAVVPVLGLTIGRACLTMAGVPIVHLQRTIFQAMGPTCSYGVPLILVHLGLIGQAIRLRSSGYAFAAGLVLNLTASLARLLSWSLAGQPIGGAEWVQVAQINAITSAGFALAWMAARAFQRTLNVAQPPSAVDRLAPGPISPASGGRSTAEGGCATITVGPLLAANVLIPAVINLALILPVVAGLVADPWSRVLATDLARSVRDGWGWSALLLSVAAAAAAVWLSQVPSENAKGTPDLALGTGHLALRLTTFCLAGLGIGSMIAFGFSGGSRGDSWAAFHALMVATLLVAWLIVPADRMLPWRPVSTRYTLSDAATFWIPLVGVLAIFLALRATAGADPGRPWWAAGVLVALSLLAGVLAGMMRNAGYLYLSAVLFNAATTLWWLTEYWPVPSPQIEGAIFDLVGVNVIALAVPALASVWLLRQLRRRPDRLGGSPALPEFHQTAATFGIAALAGLVSLGLIRDAMADPIRASVLIGWLAVGATLIAAMACWLGGEFALPPGGGAAPGRGDEPKASSSPDQTIVRVYALALVSLGLAVNDAHLAPRWLGWTLAIALAGFSLATSGAAAIVAIHGRGLATDHHNLRNLRNLWGTRAWFANANVGISLTSFSLAFCSILTFDAASAAGSGWPAVLLRYIAAAAAIVQTAAIATLAHRQISGHGTHSQGTRLRQFALILGLFAAVALGWAMLEPDGANVALNRAVAFMAAAAVTTIAYATCARRLASAESGWGQEITTLLPWLVAAVLGSVLVVMVWEVDLVFVYGSAALAMAGPAIAAVILTLAGLIALMLVFALVGQIEGTRDPLGCPPSLSDRTETARSAYVYAAEVLLVLMFLHVRLTMPWMFHGFFTQYWPVIVIVIAFLGVSLGEVFARLPGRRVLAEPLERTGLFLPALPVLGVWAVESKVDFSHQLLLIGLLYGVIAIRRRSFGFGLLAALAGNGGLWYFLHRVGGYGLLDHPQLWLIPFALSVLAAGYLNRDRLTTEQSAVLHYTCLTMIYVSSTIEIFLNGVKSPWLPMILAGLSVAGVLVGILLRVRSFLFLGSIFLLLSLVAMIWHASANLGWTWLWYVAGIILGVGLIAVFALFEKKRSQMMMIVTGMKDWKP